MKENKTKPDIRFKGFTDDWEQRKLGEIVGIYDGVHQTPKYQDSGIMFLSVENISTLQSTKYISEEDFKRDYKVYPQENDILMTRIGDVGTTNVVTDNTLKAYYVSLALLKYKNTNPYFLSNAMQSNYVQKGLANRTLKTAVPMKINKDEIGKVDVILTAAVEEQSKIGSYFKNLDNLITLHQRECNQLKELKKTMLKKMFPRDGSNIPEVRFAGFTDDWEQRKLGELGTITTGNTPSTSIPDYYSDDGIVWVTPTDICENITFESARKLSDLGQQVGRVVPKNTILVTCIASIGKNTMLGNTGSFNQQINGLTPNENKYDPYFLLTESALWSAKMKGSAAAGTMQIVNRTEFSELKTWLPSLIEQQAIGAFFKQLDHLITLHQRKVSSRLFLNKSTIFREN